MINPMNLESTHTIITGAASGIGRETAILTNALGGKAFLIDKDEDGLNKTRELCHMSQFVNLCSLDITQTDHLELGIKAAANQYGKFSSLVHCAGIPYVSPLKMINKRKMQTVIDVNAIAAIELVRIFCLKQVYQGGNGSVVLISSVYGQVGSAANVVYAMSKAGIIGITKSLAIELAPKGIRVNCIAPGFLESNMKKDIDGMFSEKHDEELQRLHPLGLGKAEDVASVIAFLLSGASRWMTGAVVNVDGGFTAI